MQAGDTVGPYRLQKLLGCGRFGIVFAGHTAEGSTAALKIPRKSSAARELAAAEVELVAACQLTHVACPLVRVLSVEHTPRIRNILALEPMTGGTLEQQAPLSWPDTARMYTTVCDGLCWLHDRGYLHCDLKPENVLVHGHVAKLSDLGNAQPLGSLQQPLTTFYYRAPETVLQQTPYTPAVDVWALGCCLYETTTGHPLFDIDEDGSTTTASEAGSESGASEEAESESESESASTDALSEPRWSSSSVSSDDSADDETEALAQLALMQAYCGTFPRETRKAKRQFFNAKGQLFATDFELPYPSLEAKLAAETDAPHPELLPLLRQVFRYKARPRLAVLRQALSSAAK